MRAASHFWKTCSISTVLAVLVIVSGARTTPLPRLGCDPAPYVLSGALAAVSTVAAPLRQVNGKQRQRWTSSASHGAPCMGAASRPHLPGPPLLLVAAAPHVALLAPARHLRGMLPLSQAPPVMPAASL